VFSRRVAKLSDIALRPIEAGDEAFLRQVYAATRESEIARTGWDAQTVERFLRMQFDAQHAHYLQHYPQASFDLVLEAGVPAGRLYVWRGESELRVVDIALLPAFRRRGIGAALLQAVQREAQQGGKRVTIHVETSNPALTLYQRLGFKELSVTGFHRLMAWSPTN
jgi:ribosomal protein S18 acetylase RimI-like enzyme